jgi:hypothetical protein
MLHKPPPEEGLVQPSSDYASFAGFEVPTDGRFSDVHRGSRLQEDFSGKLHRETAVHLKITACFPGVPNAVFLSALVLSVTQSTSL